MNLLDLYGKPIDKRFTEEEIDFIKTKIPQGAYEIFYFFYKKQSRLNAYIGYGIDQSPRTMRRTPAINSWEIISRRKLNNMEYQEAIENYGTRNRRFIVWYFKTIEDLIQWDAEFNEKTPKEFVKMAIEKGWSKDPIKTRIDYGIFQN
jgi:hypothetical protein